MGIITISVPTAGQPRTAASVANPLNTIKNEFNGNIDDANVKPNAGISWSKVSKVGSQLSEVADVDVAGVATGDLLYRNAAGKWARLAIAAAKKILRVHPSDGVPQWGANLDDLDDVEAPTPADGQALKWIAADSKWKPGSAQLTSDQVAVDGSMNSTTFTSMGSSLTGNWAAGTKLLLYLSGTIRANNDRGVSSYARIYDETAAVAVSPQAEALCEVDNQAKRVPLGLVCIYTVPAGGGARTFRAQIRNSRGNAPDSSAFEGGSQLGYLTLG